MSETITIQQIHRSEPWDSYVQKNPRADFSHFFGWRRVIQEV